MWRKKKKKLENQAQEASRAWSGEKTIEKKERNRKPETRLGLGVVKQTNKQKRKPALETCLRPGVVKKKRTIKENQGSRRVSNPGRMKKKEKKNSSLRRVLGLVWWKKENKKISARDASRDLVVGVGVLDSAGASDADAANDGGGGGSYYPFVHVACK